MSMPWAAPCPEPAAGVQGLAALRCQGHAKPRYVSFIAYYWPYCAEKSHQWGRTVLAAWQGAELLLSIQGCKREQDGELLGGHNHPPGTVLGHHLGTATLMSPLSLRIVFWKCGRWDHDGRKLLLLSSSGSHALFTDFLPYPCRSISPFCMAGRQMDTIALVTRWALTVPWQLLPITAVMQSSGALAWVPALV